MTPLEGLMMGTRSGDIDPAIVPFVMGKEDLTLGEVNSMLNKHSGLLAISGIQRRYAGNRRGDGGRGRNAKLAFDMYYYRLRKYIGAYAAAMNGLDAIVFTAGIGENSAHVRKAVCEGLTFLGVELDEAANQQRSKEARFISAPDSRVKVLVVPTNEELIIARDTFRLVSERKAAGDSLVARGQ